MQVALSEDFMEALGKLNGNEIKKHQKLSCPLKRNLIPMVYAHIR